MEDPKIPSEEGEVEKPKESARKAGPEELIHPIA